MHHFSRFAFFGLALIQANSTLAQKQDQTGPLGSGSGEVRGAAFVRNARRIAADEATVAALHREWILVGWERKEGDGPLNFRQKLGKYYDWSSKDVVLYDDFDPKRRVVRSAAAYGAIWEAPFSALRSAKHRVVSGPFVLVSGDLATSTLEFAARLTGKNGKVTGIRTFSSLVWHRTANGWKIVREHNSSTVLTPAQLDALMKPASKP